MQSVVVTSQENNVSYSHPLLFTLALTLGFMYVSNGTQTTVDHRNCHYLE